MIFEGYNNTYNTARQSTESATPEHSGVEEIKLLLFESIYWMNMNNNIEEKVKKNSSTCLDLGATWPKYKRSHTKY